VKADGTRLEVKGKSNLRLGEGDRIILESCGGGGYGPPITSGKREKAT
jgi:N-methylhydantoinase B/oxoprolinase/acetone carboxylase alpha subunit